MNLAVKLKLGTHMDGELKYHVYQNQSSGPIARIVTSLDRFFFNLPLIEKFLSLFSQEILEYNCYCLLRTSVKFCLTCRALKELQVTTQF